MFRFAILVCVCALSASVFGVGCGGPAEGDGGSSAAAAPGGNGGDSGTAGRETVELWFTAGEQFRSVKQPIGEDIDPAEAATRRLLAGPARQASDRLDTPAETQIPAGTELVDLAVDPGGTATVEVTPRFFAAVGGNPRGDAAQSELDARIGQITYTLTEFNRIDRVRVASGGIAPTPPQDRSDLAAPRQGPKPRPVGSASRSASARRIQQRLAELRYLPARAVDGVYGYRTTQAVTAFQAWEGLDRDGVVGPITQAALDSASRPHPTARSGPANRIEIYRDKGVALLVSRNRMTRAIHISAGTSTNPTPSGTYSVFRKELRSWSVPFQTWLPYASYFNAGIALHGYPDVPAYPASHGCVRVPEPEQKVMYRFAEIGRAVVVF